MTQEEKQLLLKDLSARLLYSVKLKPVGLKHTIISYATLKGISKDNNGDYHFEINDRDIDGNILSCGSFKLGRSSITYLPCLRSLSSMRVGEILCLYKFFSGETCCLPEYTEEWGDFRTAIQNNELYIPSTCDGNKVKDGFDWLDSKYIDYRGLIPKGLALEATKGMYNF